jgi:hypothetical protein
MYRKKMLCQKVVLSLLYKLSITTEEMYHRLVRKKLCKIVVLFIRMDVYKVPDYIIKVV